MSEPVCPSCGTPVQPDWEWCYKCGFDPENKRPDAMGPPPTGASHPPPPRGAPPPGYGAPPTPTPYAGPPKNDSNTAVLIGGIVVLLVIGAAAIGLVTVLRSSSKTNPAADVAAPTTPSRPTTTLEPWSAFTSPGAGFSIDLPGTPRESTYQTSTGAGRLTVHTYRVSSATREVGLEYVDAPPGSFLDMREGARLITDQYGTSPTDVVDVNYAGNPGLDFTVERTSDPNTRARVRMIRIGDRFYFLVSYRDRKEAAEQEDDFVRLMTSLKLG